MNVEVSVSQTRSVFGSSNAALRTFANSLVDEALSLPLRSSPRGAALKLISARIDSHFRGFRASINDTCALLSAMLETQVTERELQDEAALLARFPDIKETLALVLYHGRRAAQRAGNMPRQGAPLVHAASPSRHEAPVQLAPAGAAAPRQTPATSGVHHRDVVGESSTSGGAAVGAPTRDRHMVSPPLGPIALEARASQQQKREAPVVSPQLALWLLTQQRPDFGAAAGAESATGQLGLRRRKPVPPRKPAALAAAARAMRATQADGAPQAAAASERNASTPPNPAVLAAAPQAQPASRPQVPVRPIRPVALITVQEPPALQIAQASTGPSSASRTVLAAASTGSQRGTPAALPLRDSPGVPAPGQSSMRAGGNSSSAPTAAPPQPPRASAAVFAQTRSLVVSAPHSSGAANHTLDDAYPPDEAPPPYSLEDSLPPPPFEDDGAPGPSRPSTYEDLSSDYAIAMQLQMQEDEDFVDTVEWLDSDVSAMPATQAPAAAPLHAHASFGLGGSPPPALINPATQQLFQNPLFDTATGRSIDGPSRLDATLGANQIRNHALRHVLEAWQQNHSFDEAALGEALREALTCPITQDIFTEPVIAIDGNTYDAPAIRQWLAQNAVSPQTRQSMTADRLWPAQLITSLMQQCGLLQSRPSQADADDAAAANAARDDAEIVRDLQFATTALGEPYEITSFRYLGGMKSSCSSNRLERVVGNMQLSSCIPRLHRLVAVLEGRRLQGLFLAWLSDCYRVKKDTATATCAALQGMELEPASSALRLRLALLYAITNDMQMAQQYVATPALDDEEQTYLNAAQGEILRRQGNFRAALVCFEVADEGKYRLREVAAWRKLAQRENSLPSR